ncbi:MAG: hypothetical protein AAFX93_06810 [Verrucomicrobiota bacterium]
MNSSDHIWNMIKRRPTTQLAVRRFRRTVLRQLVALPARQDRR